MANPRRQQGKRWERKSQEAFESAGIPVDKVKDGYTDDYGDLLLWKDFAVVQCKDAQIKRWTQWRQELKDQKGHVGALYSVLAIKQKGKGDAREGVHDIPFNDLIDLLLAAKWAYDNGYIPPELITPNPPPGVTLSQVVEDGE